MTNTRLPIEKLKQLIQLQSSKLTTREKGRALGISQGAVWKYQRAPRLAGITDQDAQKLDETELERRVWQARTVQTVRRDTPATGSRSLVPPDCAWIHTELKRHKHVTLQLL
jgi:hypothetical protein